MLHIRRNRYQTRYSILTVGRTAWRWGINMASIGSLQSRMGRIHVSGQCNVPPVSRMAILYLFEVALPQSIYDCMGGDPSGVVFLNINVSIANVSTQNAAESDALSYIHLPRDRPSCGDRWHTKSGEFAIRGHTSDTAHVWDGSNLFPLNEAMVEFPPRIINSSITGEFLPPSRKPLIHQG